MIFVIALVLFLGGIYLFGLAFHLEELHAVVFFAGILAISLSLAIPFHMLRRR
ncbi:MULTISPECIES: hypothetical protein [Mycetocola]|uniref:hypothetical protein n=1 Tax=Mycetocola TaxID=76634 RepID=UPI001600389C|nr:MULTISPECIES: hypothetical protein [Mycetocola]MCS4277789.1 hypothetical protein [Mycetocola sp. BIGb0189]